MPSMALGREGILVNPILGLHLGAHNLCLARARMPGPHHYHHCHHLPKQRALSICWAPGQGLRGPGHFPLIPLTWTSPRVKQVLLAQAEAEKIRKIGEAEAAVIEAMGKAEAERMKLKAQAYQKYGDSAKMALVLEALPQVRLPSQAGTS